MATQGTFTPDSENEITVTNPTEVDGVTLLDNTNAVFKITITDQDGHGNVLVSAATMSYPAAHEWAYIGAPSVFPSGSILLVECKRYLIDGVTWKRTYRSHLFDEGITAA